MSIANIMVSLDLGRMAAERVRVAAGLAKRFEATVADERRQRRRIPQHRQKRREREHTDDQ